MMHLKRLTAGATVAVLALGHAAPAFAHDCWVVKKPARSGAAFHFDFDTGQITANKPNPGTFEKPHGAFMSGSGGGFEASTFVRAPEGVLPPAREGGSQYDCDGKGIDAFSACGF